MLTGKFMTDIILVKLEVFVWWCKLINIALCHEYVSDAYDPARAPDFNLWRMFFSLNNVKLNLYTIYCNVLTIFLLEWTAPTDEVDAIDVSSCEKIITVYCIAVVRK